MLDSSKAASKKLVHKAGEFIRNKIADAVTKSNDEIKLWKTDKIVKQEPAEEIIIPPEKKRRNIKQIKTSIIKMEHYKVSKLFNCIKICDKKNVSK